MNIEYETMSGLINTPYLYSTIRVGLIGKDSEEVAECLYDEAGQYCDGVNRAIAQFRSPQYLTNNLMPYFELPHDKQTEQNIRMKIQSAYLTVQAVGAMLYARLDLTISEDLTVEELKAFAEQIEAQYRDGWGADFELQDIETSSGDVICLRLYHGDITFMLAMCLKNTLRKKWKNIKPRQLWKMICICQRMA